jgi:hypothetical protein
MIFRGRGARAGQDGAERFQGGERTFLSLGAFRARGRWSRPLRHARTCSGLSRASTPRQGSSTSGLRRSRAANGRPCPANALHAPMWMAGTARPRRRSCFQLPHHDSYAPRRRPSVGGAPRERRCPARSVRHAAGAGLRNGREPQERAARARSQGAATASKRSYGWAVRSFCQRRKPAQGRGWINLVRFRVADRRIRPREGTTDFQKSQRNLARIFAAAYRAMACVAGKCRCSTRGTGTHSLQQYVHCATSGRRLRIENSRGGSAPLRFKLDPAAYRQ